MGGNRNGGNKMDGSGNFMAAKVGGLNIVLPKQDKGQNAKKKVFQPATGRNTLESAGSPRETAQPLTRASRGTHLGKFRPADGRNTPFG